jgi:hypothetical protein
MYFNHAQQKRYRQLDLNQRALRTDGMDLITWGPFGDQPPKNNPLFTWFLLAWHNPGKSIYSIDLIIYLSLLSFTVLTALLHSGSSGRTPVGVRVPASAPENSRGYGATVAPFHLVKGAWSRVWSRFAR